MSNPTTDSQSSDSTQDTTLTPEQVIEVRKVYNDRVPPLEFAEFLSRTEEKFDTVKKYSTAAAAAVLVVEDTDPVATEIATISPEQQRATIRGTVTSVSDINEFSSGGQTGQVLNVEVVDALEDGHGLANLSFWHETAETIASEVTPGDVIEASGEPGEPFYEEHVVDIAVSGDEWSLQSSETQAPGPGQGPVESLADLSHQQATVSVAGVILHTDPVELSSSGESADEELRLSLFLGDESGSCRLIVTDAVAQALCPVDCGTAVSFTSLAVCDSYGELYLQSTSETTWTISPDSPSPTYQPALTPLSDFTAHPEPETANFPNSVTVAGTVTATEPVEEYESSQGAGYLRKGTLTGSTDSIEFVCWDTRAHSFPASHSESVIIIGATVDWNEYSETVELHINDDSAIVLRAEQHVPDSGDTLSEPSLQRPEPDTQDDTSSHAPSGSDAETEPTGQSLPSSPGSPGLTTESPPEYDAEYTGRVLSSPDTPAESGGAETIEIQVRDERHTFALESTLHESSPKLGTTVTVRTIQRENNPELIVEIV